MFYVYWDSELVSAVCGIDELVSELIDAGITGEEMFYTLFNVARYDHDERNSVVQMSDGSKHVIHVTVFYAEDHHPHGIDFPF